MLPRLLAPSTEQGSHGKYFEHSSYELTYHLTTIQCACFSHPRTQFLLVIQNHLQIEAQIDASVAAEANQRAIREDFEAMNNNFLEYVHNPLLLATLIKTKQGRPDPTILRDLLVLSHQQAKKSEVGTPQYQFFTAVHQKAVRLSGGLVKEPEDWEVSELEVEILEGMYFVASVKLLWYE